MALTTQEKTNYLSLIAKGNEVAADARKVREAKRSETREKELKDQFMNWFKEAQAESRKIETQDRYRSLQHDTGVSDDGVDFETDSHTKMFKTRASAYGAKADDVRRFHQLGDNLLLASKIVNGSAKQAGSNIRVSYTDFPQYKAFVRGKSELAKALAGDNTAEGAEWLVEGVSPDFIENVRAEALVAGLHQPVIIPMGVHTLPIPGENPDQAAFFVPESTEDDATQIPALSQGTRRVVLDPVKLAATRRVSRELTMDVAFNIAARIRSQLITSFSIAWERMIIDGDTAATHQDAPSVTSPFDARKARNGYRKLALAAVKIDANDAVSSTTFRQVVQNMLVYGRPRQTAAVTNSTGYWRLQMTSEVVTVDKYGAGASVLSGEVGSLFGTPIIWSDEVRQDLNESGVYDGVTTDETIIVFPFLRGWATGIKQEATVETETNILTDQIVMVVNGRVDNQPLYNTATERIVGVLYDINTGS